MKTNIINNVPSNMSTKKVQKTWWIPAGLILLSVIPLIFGACALHEKAKELKWIIQFSTLSLLSLLALAQL